MPPTPLQNSCSSFEEEQGHFEVEDQTRSVRDRTVIARTKRYLEESKISKVEVEDLESLLGPDDSDVDFRRILEEIRDKRGYAIFETFSTDGPSAYLVVCCMRWNERQKRLNAQWEELRSVQPTWQQTRLLQRVEDSGKRAWKSSGLRRARRKERC